MTTKQEQKSYLEKYQKRIENRLVEIEVDIRYFERKKIKSKEGQLTMIEQRLIMLQGEKAELQGRLEVAEDTLKELK